MIWTCGAVRLAGAVIEPVGKELSLPGTKVFPARGVPFSDSL